MLVIRRRPGESVMLGNDIEIEILDAGSSHVKLGIRAPKSVIVLRKEILLVQQQNHASSLGITNETFEKLLDTLTNPSAKPISPL